MKLFCGFDHREAQGFGVFLQSVIRHTRSPFEIIPLTGSVGGTNAFTNCRFDIPKLCDYKGSAIYLDASDMLCRSDLRGLMDLYDSQMAVQVVKHNYFTRHPRKYIGTPMESLNQDYHRKNWSSLIIWNCEFPLHREIDKCRQESGALALHKFAWLPDERIGELPGEWNHLVGEHEYDPGAKLAHFTLGIPGFDHYKNCDYSEEWYSFRRGDL